MKNSITVITNIKNRSTGKTFEADPITGKISKVTSPIYAVTTGSTISFNTMSEFASILQGLLPTQSIMLESLSVTPYEAGGVLPVEFTILSKAAMEGQFGEDFKADKLYKNAEFGYCITRSPAAFTPSDMLCLDKDLCIGYETLTDNQLIDILSTLIYKDFEGLESLTTNSSSARIGTKDFRIQALNTGSNSHTFILTQPLKGANKKHHDFLKNVHQRLILAGYYHKDSDKSLIDPSVGSRCRVFYEGAPSIAEGSEEYLQVLPKQVTVKVGKVLDTGGLPPLTAEQIASVRNNKKFPQHGLSQGRGEYYYDAINELTMFEVEIGRSMILMPWGDSRIQNMQDDQKLRCQVPDEIRTESRSMNGLIRKDSSGVPFIYDNGSGFHYKSGASAATEMFKSVEQGKAVVAPVLGAGAVVAPADGEILKLFQEIKSSLIFAIGETVYMQCIEEAVIMLMLERIVWDAKDNKFKVINRGSVLKSFTDGKLTYAISCAVDDAPYIIRKNHASHNNDEEMKEFYKTVSNVIHKHLVINRQVSDVQDQIDIMRSKGHSKFTIEDNAAIHNKPFKDFDHVGDFNPVIHQRYVDDYKTRFPIFDNFLEVITASRFSNDNRSSTLLLKAVTSWGKGLLFEAILGEKASGGLGIVYDLDLNKLAAAAAAGKTSGYDINQLDAAWILYHDEIKRFDEDFKHLDNYIQMILKYEAGFNYKIRFKAMTAAKSIDEANEGVTDELMERLNFYEAKEGGNLNFNPLFIEDKQAYKDALRAYAKMIILGNLYRFRAMNNSQRSNTTGQVLRTWYETHSMKNASSPFKDLTNDVMLEHMGDLLNALGGIGIITGGFKEGDLTFEQGMGVAANDPKGLAILSNCSFATHTNTETKEVTQYLKVKKIKTVIGLWLDISAEGGNQTLKLMKKDSDLALEYLISEDIDSEYKAFYKRIRTVKNITRGQFSIKSEQGSKALYIERS